MLKKLLSVTLLSAILITGCSTSTNSFKDATNLLQQSNISSVKTSNSNWYQKLSPELQDYYSEAEGETGENLFFALRKIISRHKKIGGYSSSKGYMYEHIDNVGGDKPGILTTYSQIFIPGSGSNGNRYVEKADENGDGAKEDFINCEHIWPQSFFKRAHPMRADIHHLQATLSRPNNRRDSLPFGEVTSKVRYKTSSNSRLGMGQGNEKVFEPTDVSKGNVARSMMYFYTRYGTNKIKNGHYNETRHWDSKVGMFIRWSTVVDQVDSREKLRNEGIFEKQGNRNPFIDVPEFANLIGEEVFKRL